MDEVLLSARGLDRELSGIRPSILWTKYFQDQSQMEAYLAQVPLLRLSISKILPIEKVDTYIYIIFIFQILDSA